MNLKKRKYVFLAAAVLITVSAAVTACATNKPATDTINTDENVVYIKIDEADFTTSGLDKEEKVQRALEDRLEQNLNELDGIKNTDITLNDDSADVELTLYPDRELTEDMESNVKSLIHRASSFEEDEIFISVHLDD